MSTLRTRVQTRRAAVVTASDTPADALYRAERAKQLLDDPVLVSAFAEIEMAHIEATLRADADDEMRRRAADRVNAVRDVWTKLEGLVSEAERKAREGLRLP